MAATPPARSRTSRLPMVARPTRAAAGCADAASATVSARRPDEQDGARDSAGEVPGARDDRGRVRPASRDEDEEEGHHRRRLYRGDHGHGAGTPPAGQLVAT